jgi:ectoine hydroxylase-related dioxygenase (phytanoyl-CoA dioxygenase family)
MNSIAGGALMTATMEMVSAPARLNDEQREFFEQNGYLVVRNALSEEQIAHYTRIVDELAGADRAARGVGEDASVEIRNAIALSDELLPILDWPATFPLMAEILGWNIQLTTSHVFVRTPTPQAQNTFKAIDWHADGPNPKFPAINGVTPRMYAKIGYFLTDLSRPDKGNLRVVPSSHLSAHRPENDPATGEPIGAIQVLTQPGDAVLFEQRTWHAVGPNYSDEPRKNIYIGYCYRWLKAIDFITQSPELIAKGNPIQRQLLGHITHELSYYLPGRSPEDVPLQAWLEEHLKDAV